MKRAYKIAIGLFVVVAIVLISVALTVGTLNISASEQTVSVNSTYSQYSTVVSLQSQIVQKIGVPVDVSGMLSYSPFARQSIPTIGTVEDLINNLQQELNMLGSTSDPKQPLKNALTKVL